MKRNDGAVSDEMVELYRGLLAVNTATAQRPITPGAGVDPKRVIRPSKRLRNWHRSSGTGFSLKTYVRVLSTNGGDSYALARRWLASKGVRP